MFVRLIFSRRLALAVVAGICFAGAASADDARREPKTREFELNYSATVTGMSPGVAARIWLPSPPTSDDQTVTVLAVPEAAKSATEPKYNNTILYVDGTAGADGNISVAAKFKVVRKEVISDGGKVDVPKEEVELFLKPDKMVPLNGKPSKLLEGKSLPSDQIELAKVFYDVVDGHMKYSKEGKGWGRGDSEWACDSKFGNCTDFHSVFISMARSNHIPAKFEIGFSVPEKRGEGEIAGYHCWAKFKPTGKGWIPVDISEANKNPKMKDYYFGNLTADRVTLSCGRDIDLVPKQNGPALNFFVFPYVEVDGKPLPNEQIKRKVTYKDLSAN